MSECQSACAVITQGIFGHPFSPTGTESIISCFLIFAASSNVIHDFWLYIHLKLASKLISPHKGHKEDLSAAMIILNFYNDLDNVFSMPSSFFLGREGIFVRCKWCKAFLRGGGGQLVLGNGDFVVTPDLDGVSWSCPGYTSVIC